MLSKLIKSWLNFKNTSYYTNALLYQPIRSSHIEVKLNTIHTHILIRNHIILYCQANFKDIICVRIVLKRFKLDFRVGLMYFLADSWEYNFAILENAVLFIWQKNQYYLISMLSMSTLFHNSCVWFVHNPNSSLVYLSLFFLFKCDKY